MAIENAEEMDAGYNLDSANVSVFVSSAPALHTAVTPFKLRKFKRKGCYLGYFTLAGVFCFNRRTQVFTHSQIKIYL